MPELDEPVEGGGLRFVPDERALRVEGLPPSFRLAIASGGRADAPAADLYVVIDPVPTERPTEPRLVLPGAAPIPESIGDAIDLTGFRTVRLGPLELAVVPGTPDGRYAEAAEPCGFGDDDVAGLALEEPASDVHRVLLAYAGPAGVPSTVGHMGQDAGSSLVRRVMDETHASGALFAFPTTQLERGASPPTWDRVEPVSPASGPAVVRADGGRVRPGWTVFEVTERGLARLDSGGGPD